MKRVFASIGFGVLLLAAWICIIVFTSTDFVHEGPNSVWAAPIEWWGSLFRWSGLGRVFRSLGRTAEEILIFPLLFAPFIVLFSFISYFALRLFARRFQRSMP